MSQLTLDIARAVVKRYCHAVAYCRQGDALARQQLIREVVRELRGQVAFEDAEKALDAALKESTWSS